MIYLWYICMYVSMVSLRGSTKLSPGRLKFMSFTLRSLFNEHYNPPLVTSPRTMTYLGCWWLSGQNSSLSHCVCQIIGTPDTAMSHLIFCFEWMPWMYFGKKPRLPLTQKASGGVAEISSDTTFKFSIGAPSEWRWAMCNIHPPFPRLQSSTMEPQIHKFGHLGMGQDFGRPFITPNSWLLSMTERSTLCHQHSLISNLTIPYIKFMLFLLVQCSPWFWMTQFDKVSWWDHHLYIL